VAGPAAPGRIRSRDDDWYWGDSHTETVTRVGAPDVPLPGIDEFGPVGDAVLTFDTDSLNAYAAADARPLWELDLGAPDAMRIAVPGTRAAAENVLAPLSVSDVALMQAAKISMRSS